VCFDDGILGNWWKCLSGTDRPKVAQASWFLYRYYEDNRAQGYGACDRLILSAACGTETDEESRALYRARYTAWENGLAGNYLFEACTPGPYTAVNNHLKLAYVRGRVPLWVRFGPASYDYVFQPLEYLTLWKGNRPATNSDPARGDVLFLFKVAVYGGEGVWLCAHGPKQIKRFFQFLDAQMDRSLKPLWGSLDNVIAKGWHSWYTFDNNTWRWKDGCVPYETTVPDYSDSESDD